MVNAAAGFVRHIFTLVVVLALGAAALLVPLPLEEGRTIVNSVIIARSPDEVFDYVTRPAHWPAWHPSSLAVSGAVDHSLQVGEQVSEEFLVAGQRGRALWTVVARDAPRRWSIEGQAEGGGGATISYRLAAVPGGTRFERELHYRSPNLLFRFLDALVLRERIEAESAEAVRRLKAMLEGQGKPPANG